jgi:GNAT superfamily N-acetyltransferase
MSDLHLRRAIAEDAPALSRLLGELGHPAPAALVRDRLGELAALGERQVAIVAQLGSEIVGLATGFVTPVLHRPRPVGRLSVLVVAEGSRGHGVGRRLVEAAEEFFAGAACERIELTSGSERIEAHGFYERLGYHEMGKRFVKET